MEQKSRAYCDFGVVSLLLVLGVSGDWLAEPVVCALEFVA
jgi:hypothetical protein